MVRYCSFHYDIFPALSECVHACRRSKISGMVVSTGLTRWTLLAYCPACLMAAGTRAGPASSGRGGVATPA